MKKLLILGALTLLAGCTAGMKDSFDCNATAQDSCMTMEEANQKAAQQNITWNHPDNGEGASQKRAELPRLAPLATPIIPVATIASTVSRSTGGMGHANSPTLGAFEQVKAPSTTNKSVSTLPSVTPVAQAWNTWGDIGMSPPVRLPASTARLWIAPWVDEVQNFYQPAVVSFVVKEGQWKEQVQ